MNPDSFCTEFSNMENQPSSGRRLSTSWDNEVMTGGLTVPRVDQRRNSSTLAQLMECHRQLSLNERYSSDAEEEESRSRAGSRRPSTSSRRASVGSRRPSVAEMLVDTGVSKTTDDCVMVTQTLGSSNTYFFQKNPLVDNLDLRPSAVERGLYNFDDSIKEAPLVPSFKYLGTPRPSIQLPQSPRPSTLSHSIPSIDESDGERMPNISLLSVRPSLEERGLPAMKYTPVHLNGELPRERGRTLQKQPRADPRFHFELDKIIAHRRKIIDDEETKRERENRIRPRVPQTQQGFQRPHCYDGRSPYQLKVGNVMEELRNQMESGEVDRIVKEKKTTTLSPTGVPVQNPNRRSITIEGSLPEILDRPYVRASAQEGNQPSSSEGKAPMKTVTIRVPENHQELHPRGHPIHRSATPSPHNVADGRRENSASP